MAYVSRRRFLVGGLGAAAGMAMLTACGQPSQPPASGSAGAGPASASKPQQVTLRFLTTESDPPSQKVYDEAVAAFRQQNPNITIEMEYIGFDSRTEKVVTGIGAKRAPQITQLVAYEVLEYGRLGYLSQVDDLITETGGRDKWQKGSLDGSQIDGKVYALPYNGGAYRTLWYRDDLFKQQGIQPPKNWDEYKRVAEDFTKDTNNDGSMDMFGSSLPGGKNRWTMSNYMKFLWQTGETVFDQDFNVIFGKEGAVRALQFYKDMIAFGPPGFANYSYNETIDAFVSGKAATQPYAGRTLTRVYENAPDMVQATRGAKIPSGPIGGDVGSVSWDMYAVFNEKVGVSTAEQDAAKKFLKHILTGKTATDFALTVPGHLIPPHLDTLKDPQLWEGHPLMKSHKAEIEWMFNTENSLDYITEAGATITAEKVTPGPVNPYWPAIDASLVIPTMVQRTLVQNEDPKVAVQWGAEEMKRLVDDARKKAKQ
ncbi:MAG: extracellular solute-binding protein [Chloroflexota bacterium]|nr:extracellular solute-binding protein [Chloroflexota bacterium]